LKKLNGHALGDGHDGLDAGIDGFQDGVGREGGGDEDHRGVGARLADGLFHGVKDGQALDGLAPLARRHAADHLGSVFLAALGVELPHLAGDPLADDAGVFVDQDAHGFSLLSGPG
jgi:hypothetical protein